MVVSEASNGASNTSLKGTFSESEKNCTLSTDISVGTKAVTVTGFETEELAVGEETRTAGDISSLTDWPMPFDWLARPLKSVLPPMKIYSVKKIAEKTMRETTMENVWELDFLAIRFFCHKEAQLLRYNYFWTLSRSQIFYLKDEMQYTGKMFGRLKNFLTDRSNLPVILIVLFFIGSLAYFLFALGFVRLPEKQEEKKKEEVTPTLSPSDTPTPTEEEEPSPTRRFIPTNTPKPTATKTPTPTNTPSPTSTPTPSPTQTPTPTPSVSPADTPTPTFTPTPAL